MYLKADLAVVLANIRRILPGRDPIAVLASQPQVRVWVGGGGGVGGHLCMKQA